ncbi:hypothetical protein ElyMa_000448400 [Elysia marginata]|uniref:Uncharacterized protein n=1 Tax=Elysia marginata TaxID=1093978 RepID=A0AAV4FPD8_9GAST|nr:hypothetical protein ElyMa_000448400 [Elysia marginata]
MSSLSRLRRPRYLIPERDRPRLDIHHRLALSPLAQQHRMNSCIPAMVQYPPQKAGTEDVRIKTALVQTPESNTEAVTTDVISSMKNTCSSNYKPSKGPKCLSTLPLILSLLHRLSSSQKNRILKSQPTQSIT